MYNRKSAGRDVIPIELVKAGGEEAVKVMMSLCNCMWKMKDWPTYWKESVCVPIYRPHNQPEVDGGESQGSPERLVGPTCASSTTSRPSIVSTMKCCGDTNGYGSARTPDIATAKAVHQPGSDSQKGVWIHGERSATGMYPHPLLFNIYAENIMREDLEECESGISVGRRMVTDLIYAEDTTLLVWDQERLDRACRKS